MKKLLLSLFALSTTIIYAQTPCSGQTAGGFGCNVLTLQSQLTIAQMGGTGYGGSDPMEAQDSWGWTDPLDGKEYALIAMNDQTAFVDISNPNSPIYLGKLHSHTSTSWWRDVKVHNNYAYIVSDDNGNHGMQIFDLTRLRSVASPPVTFTEDGWKTWGSGGNRGKAHNIVINEDTGYAYVVGTSGYANGGVVIFNLSNPTNPSQVGTISSLGYCHDAQVVVYNGPDTEHVGKEILIGAFTASDNVTILDVTNKSNITQIGTVDYTSKRYTHQGWFTEDQKYFIVGDEQDETSFGINTRTLVFDMTDLDNPVLHHTYSGPTSAIDHNGYVVGNRFYLANYRAGMRVIKIDELYDATPNMTEVAYFDTHPGSDSAAYHGAWNVYPFFESGNIIISDLDEGLIIVKDPNFDNIDPVAVCQNITATLDKTTGTVTIDALDVDGGSTDNIGIVSRSISGQTTFTCNDVGSTFNVTLTVEDDYGNTSSCVSTVTVAGETTSYLGSGSWSNGAPGIGSNAKISSNYDTSSYGSIDACTCEVDATRTLTINGDDYLKTTKDITVNGTLIVEHQGNVVQTDPFASVIKNGIINVNVTSPILRKRDFMIMGSPMTTESRTGVWNSSFLVLDFHPENFIPHPDVPAGGTNFADDDADFYTEYTTGPLNPGEGYINRPQSGYNDPTVPPSGRTFDFTYELGTLNNGDISYTNYNNGAAANPNGTPNIVANPYACAIDGDVFMASNPGVGALYFWEHLTPPGAPLANSNLRFDMDDLSVYNGVMGIPAANDPGNTFGTAPNGIIATGQGFGIRTNGGAGTTGTIIFNNDMRLTSGNNTLRGLGTTTEVATTEKLLLEIRDKSYGYGSFAGIAFNEHGTAAFDEGMDTNRLSTIVSLFSHLDDGSGEFGIQTRGLFGNDEKIPVGFASQIDEELEYEISLTSLEGLNLENVTVYLYDLQENQIVNLENNSYIFKSGMGVFNERFTIIFKAERVLGPNENMLSNVTVFPNPTSNNINIFSPDAVLVNLEVYDLMGRKISQKIEGPKNTFKLDLSSLKTGVYFIHIKTENGTITKKIIKE